MIKFILLVQIYYGYGLLGSSLICYQHPLLSVKDSC